MSSKILRICLLASLLLVLSIFFLYKGANWPLGVQGIEAVGALALLLTMNLALFLYRRRASSMNSYQQKSIMLGLFTGLLWTAEIGMNNILQPGLPIRDILDDLFWAVIALIILVASIQCTYQTNKLRIGMEVGFWSGSIACLTALLFVVIGMQFLLHDPLNIAEWSARGATSGTPNMAAYFAYQTLAGALLHIVVLGVMMGRVLGVIGGVLGRVGNYIGKK